MRNDTLASVLISWTAYTEISSHFIFTPEFIAASFVISGCFLDGFLTPFTIGLKMMRSRFGECWTADASQSGFASS